MTERLVTRSDILLHVESGEHNIQLSNMPDRHPNISMGDRVSEAYLANLGYALIKRVAKPINDVVVELPPYVLDGVLTQRWSDRKFNEEELAERLAAKKRERFKELNSAANAAIVECLSFNAQDTLCSMSVADYTDLATALFMDTVNGVADDKTYIVITTCHKYIELTRDQAKQLIDVSRAAIDDIKSQAMAIYDDINNCAIESEMPHVPHVLQANTYGTRPSF